MKKGDILYLIRAMDEMGVEYHEAAGGRWPKHIKDMYEQSIAILNGELIECKSNTSTK